MPEAKTYEFPSALDYPTQRRRRFATIRVQSSQHCAETKCPASTNGSLVLPLIKIAVAQLESALAWLSHTKIALGRGCKASSAHCWRDLRCSTMIDVTIHISLACPSQGTAQLTAFCMQHFQHPVLHHSDGISTCRKDDTAQRQIQRQSCGIVNDEPTELKCCISSIDRKK